MDSQYTSIKDAMKKGIGKVFLHGWAYRERKSSNVVFIVLRDYSDIIQCVVKKDAVSENEWSVANSVSIETSLKLAGEIRKDSRAPTGFEVSVENIEIVGKCGTFPITKDQSPEFLLDKRHLWVRSRRLVSIFKIRSTVFKSIQDFFRELGYYEIQAPIFTPNACEGGSTLFEVKFFEDKVYLTQSWQLYAESLIFGMEKIFCISPCFRAERSKTSRHLAEFWMAEMESAWLNIEDTSAIAENLVARIVSDVLKYNQDELAILQRDIEKLKVIHAPFQRLTYTQAIEMLKKDGLEVEWGKDLRTIEEDKLMDHFKAPVIITNYPKEIMAFYKPADPKEPETALCFDMLAPDGYGEIIGGSQRETDIDALKRGIEKQGEKAENYEWYLDLRRYGSVPHSGFGMGVERVVAWICGIDNIKDTIPFPRTMLRKSP